MALFLKYLIILLVLLALGYLVWRAFVKNSAADLKRSEESRRALQQQVLALQRQLDEMSRSPLNVTGLTPVLHLAVLNIDTSFTRTYIREDTSRGLRFEGALRADICAEYGVRLEEVRFRFDEAQRTLYIANFHPGIISYSKKQLSWDLARAFRKRRLLGRSLPPLSDNAAQAYASEMTHSLRAEVEKEIDERKIEEFDWLSPVVSRQVQDVLRAALGRPEIRIEQTSQPASDGFIGIEELSRVLTDTPKIPTS